MEIIKIAVLVISKPRTDSISVKSETRHNSYKKLSSMKFKIFIPQNVEEKG